MTIPIAHFVDLRVELRPAAAADVAAIAAVWHQAWIDGHVGHVPEAIHEHRRPEDFLRRVPGRLPRTTVATVGSRLLGFAMVHDDQVEEVYVAAAARGTGVAAALLHDAESRVGVSFDEAWLAVAAGNARARRFYERQGWRDAGGFDYDAEIAGGTMSMPCRRYVKALVGGQA